MMAPDHLDRCYTALSEALGRTGAEHAALLLATLSLALMVQQPEAQRVLELIDQAERLART